MAYVNYKRAKNAETPENNARYYLKNAELLPEVILAKSTGKVTDKLAEMLLRLTRKYAQRPCFSGYTYKEDMISDALVNLCHNALKFKPEKSSNPFSFYTTCINNSFLQFLNVEKKHRKIRDKLLIDMGENPSFAFSEEYNAQNGDGAFSTELSELKQSIEEAHINTKKDEEYAAAKAKKEALALALLENADFVEIAESEVESSFIEPDDVLIGSLVEFEDDNA
jgi:DNA-directed RNA polymerase specialized sigma subunit